MTEYIVGDTLTDKDEARAKAQAKAKQMKRDTITASCEVIGNATVRAGMGLRFASVRPGIDGVSFVITSARHRFSKQGFTTAIDAELKV